MADKKTKKPSEKQNKKIILLFTVLFIALIIVLAVISTNKNEEEKVDEYVNLDENGKVMLITNYDYVDSHDTFIGTDQDEKFTEEMYIVKQENEKIEMEQLGLPYSIDELLNNIYYYSQSGEYDTALKQVSYFIEKKPEEKEDLKTVLEDLNILTLIQEKASVKMEHLLKQLRDPELFLYGFLEADLDYQKENITIEESIVVPEYGQVVFKEKINSINLPHFDKYLDSRDMKDKEIWKMRLPINKYTPDVFYYIIHNIETQINVIYYSEFAEEFPDEFTTRYTHLY